MLITVIHSCGTRMSKIPFFHTITDSALLFSLVKIPDVMDIVIAKLNQVCIYTVPKYYTFTKVNFSFIAGVRKEYFIENVFGDINQWVFCKGKVRFVVVVPINRNYFGRVFSLTMIYSTPGDILLIN